MTGDEVLAALRIAHIRHQGAVTVAELGWVCAAEIEWAHRNDPGPPITVDPTPQALAGLRRRLTALHRRGLAEPTAGTPRRWQPTPTSHLK